MKIKIQQKQSNNLAISNKHQPYTKHQSTIKLIKKTNREEKKNKTKSKKANTKRKKKKKKE